MTGFPHPFPSPGGRGVFIRALLPFTQPFVMRYRTMNGILRPYDSASYRIVVRFLSITRNNQSVGSADNLLSASGIRRRRTRGPGNGVHILALRTRTIPPRAESGPPLSGNVLDDEPFTLRYLRVNGSAVGLLFRSVFRWVRHSGPAFLYTQRWRPVAAYAMKWKKRAVNTKDGSALS